MEPGEKREEKGREDRLANRRKKIHSWRKKKQTEKCGWYPRMMEKIQRNVLHSRSNTNGGNDKTTSDGR